MVRSDLLRQEVVDDLAAVDDLDRAVAGSHELLVGDDPEAVVDGREQVFDSRAGFRRARWRSGSSVP